MSVHSCVQHRPPACQRSVVQCTAHAHRAALANLGWPLGAGLASLLGLGDGNGLAAAGCAGSLGLLGCRERARGATATCSCALVLLLAAHEKLEELRCNSAHHKRPLTEGRELQIGGKARGSSWGDNDYLPSCSLLSRCPVVSRGCRCEWLSPASLLALGPG